MKNGLQNTIAYLFCANFSESEYIRRIRICYRQRSASRNPPMFLPCSSQVPPKYLPFFEREKKEEKGRDKGRKSDEVKYVECDTPRDFLARQQNVSLRSHDNLRLIYGHLRSYGYAICKVVP